jgi:hypothetical protein
MQRKPSPKRQVLNPSVCLVSDHRSPFEHILQCWQRCTLEVAEYFDIHDEMTKVVDAEGASVTLAVNCIDHNDYNEEIMMFKQLLFSPKRNVSRVYINQHVSPVLIYR